MTLQTKMLKRQIGFFKPFADGCSINTCRLAQQKMGELMGFSRKMEVSYDDVEFEHFKASWVNPVDLRNDGVVLFLHGGGYVAGDLKYTKGYGALFAAKTKTKVFCPAYRLAPEYPFPAALDDALTAYRYLLKSGYKSKKIVLCGESAGGGLLYALILKLKEKNLPLPCGVIAFSPWVDLTMSGDTFETNREADPSMTKERLVHYAEQYCDDVKNPFVSPLYGNLENMPPSLIFVGNDEVMRDDSVSMHQKLQRFGNESEIVIAPNMWHVYVLYDLKEREHDYERINEFLDKKISKEGFTPAWMKLDNAAKIYPAARRRNWSSVFRLSMSLTEDVNRYVLQTSLEATIRRFPSIAVRMKKGAFWYYLEQLEHAPVIIDDGPFPTKRMEKKEIRKCAFRVLCFKNRIAVEFFHALTDGNGGMVFLKTLVAEYIEQKYSKQIPCEKGVLDVAQEPLEEELEDSFLKFTGEVSAGRKEQTAFHLSGNKNLDGYKNLICFSMDVNDVIAVAKGYNTTMTCLMTSLLIKSIIEIQNDRIPIRKLQRPVKVLLPVNLKNFFKSNTLRNFVLYITPGVDPRMGDYTFEEIIKSVQHQMGLELTAKNMSAKITANVKTEQYWISRIMPLFIKNFGMKLVYDLVAERKSCLTLSNLGRVEVPKVMGDYVTRTDFVLGIQATCPNNCGMLSYNDKLYMSFIRNIEETTLETRFYENLKKLSIKAKLESNER